jgi:hypothetical protein
MQEHINPKTVSLLARAYIRRALAGEPFAEARARDCLTWLERHVTPGYSGAAWGYSFAWQSRRLWLDARAPSAVCTSFVAQAFLDAHAAWGAAQHLTVARSAAEFLLRDCPRWNGCISYVPDAMVLVHNANTLAAAVLARVWRASGAGESELCDAAEQAAAFTLADQRPDSSWTYDASSTRRGSFVDGFHTGLVVESLDDVAGALGLDYSPCVARGLAFYRSAMIDRDGRPGRLLGRDAPTDIRDCAEALIMLRRFRDEELRARVWRWTQSHMLCPTGYFKYEYGGRLAAANHIPYLRWQAWMLVALLT